MKKRVVVWWLMVTVLLLAGCFGRKSADKKDFTVDVCNDYIQYMRCVADSPNAPYTQELVDQLVGLWKTYPDNELQQACTVMLNDAIEKMKDIVTDCEIPTVAELPPKEIEMPMPNVNENIQTDESSSESDRESTWDQSELSGNETNTTTPDRSVIDAISGKIDEPSASTNTETSQSLSISQEDAQIVSMVINEITTSSKINN